jgi:hypothetical protein
VVDVSILGRRWSALVCCVWRIGREASSGIRGPEQTSFSMNEKPHQVHQQSALHRDVLSIAELAQEVQMSCYFEVVGSASTQNTTNHKATANTHPPFLLGRCHCHWLLPPFPSAASPPTGSSTCTSLPHLLQPQKFHSSFLDPSPILDQISHLC